MENTNLKSSIAQKIFSEKERGMTCFATGSREVTSYWGPRTDIGTSYSGDCQLESHASVQ
jgi:hypothetical protein